MVHHGNRLFAKYCEGTLIHSEQHYECTSYSQSACSDVQYCDFTFGMISI